MNIFIDARAITGNYRGIGFFLKNILAALSRLGSPHHFTLLVSRLETLAGLELPGKRTIIETRLPLGVADVLTIPRLLNRQRPDLAWFPANNCAPFIRKEIAVVCSIHDLMFYTQHSPFLSRQWLGSRYRRIFSRIAFRRAQEIHTGTRTIQELLSRFSGRPLHDFFFTWHGLNLSPRSDDSILHDLDLVDTPFVYTIAGTSPNKNLATAIRAFLLFREQYRRHEFRFVVTGVPDQARYREKNRVPPEVIFTPYITNEQKSALLEQCALFLFLSRDEGFGMPPSEAAFFRKPIIVSDIPVLRELYEGIATLTSTDDIARIAGDMEAILQAPVSYDASALLGKLDWEKAAAKILQQFESITGICRSGEENSD